VPVHAEAVHRAAAPGEEHTAEHDEPEQVPGTYPTKRDTYL
jgi:hypothetical protein